ncbi:hypothetical protein [Bermanella sp. R86510]|uniref:hypothetical protein n=1 Tax=unclassified Bermanella TaxID=2627862 RepID=UPI0037C9D56F
MKRLTINIFVLIFSVFIFKSHAESENTGFRDEACTEIKKQFVESIPYKKSIRFGSKTMKDSFHELDDVSLSKSTCNFYEETDISMKLNFDFEIEYHKNSKSPSYSGETPIQSFSGVLECYFTSQYEWNCAYTNISRSYVRIAVFAPFVPYYTGVQEFDITPLQSVFSNILISKIDEYY